ncbi:MAG: hypothetical protein OXE86_05565 [Alphaproteobacteria bacterium]|nr:hypothetical protein [Alphaproteobacteria bacterium]
MATPVHKFLDARSWWWLATRKSLDSHLMLRSAIGPGHPIVTRDGGLMTLFEFHGCRTIGGGEQRAGLADRLATRLAGALRLPGHALHLVFDRHPAAGPGIAGRAVIEPGAAADRLGLVLDDVLEDREQALAARLVREHCYLALWTGEAALAPGERRRSRARLAGRETPMHEGLVPRHDAVARDLVDAAGSIDLVLRRLDAAETLGVIRAFLAGHADAADRLDGGIVARMSGLAAPHRAAVRRPPLAASLIVGDPEVAGGLVRVRGTWFASLHVILPPAVLRGFDELLASAAGVPFRQSILVESGAGPALWKHACASILAVAGHANRVIRDQIDALRAAAADGEPLVRVSMHWITWGCCREEAERNRAALARRVGAWGDQAVSEIPGDPLETWAASIPGFAACATAPRAIAPLRDVIALMPLQRPASPAGPDQDRSGVQVCAGDGGKPLAVPVLGEGEHSFQLVCGEPGKGKSVLLNSRALATVLTGGQAELPRIAIIDIGPSASGLVSLLRAALGPERRGEAVHLRLTAGSVHAVNPFDTPLGCRRPPAHQADFLRNLVGAMLRPDDAAVLPAGLDTLVPEVIAEAYRMRDDAPPDAHPTVHEPGLAPGVDAALDPAPETPWWHLVDRLIERGRLDLARLAQRHAVPVLADLALAANAPAVRERHLDVAVAGGQNVLQALVRVLGAAVRDYAALSGRTVLDLSGARVAVLDLAEVADPLRPRRTAIFYLAARQLLAGDWFLTEEDVDAMPELVRPWHRDRLGRLLETEKLLQYDEFHRTGGIPELIAQVGRDAREGRKHRRRLVLASQRLEDFDVSLRELASAVWILGADSAAAREQMASDCALDADARQVLEHRLTGPGPQGAPALLVTRPGEDRTVQLVHTVLGPVELWALGTRPQDVALRERLYRRLDPGEARAALAARYPAGTLGRTAIRAGLADGHADETAVLNALADGIVDAIGDRRDRDLRDAVVRHRTRGGRRGSRAAAAAAMILCLLWLPLAPAAGQDAPGCDPAMARAMEQAAVRGIRRDAAIIRAPDGGIGEPRSLFDYSCFDRFVDPGALDVHVSIDTVLAGILKSLNDTACQLARRVLDAHLAAPVDARVLRHVLPGLAHSHSQGE